MAKDIFHEAAKQALINDGWTVTHDPFHLNYFGKDLYIDLGAERLIAAQKENELIAVEVKSFISASLVYDFHLAMGQYLNYVRALQRKDPNRVLYLAITEFVYNSFFTHEDVQDSLAYHRVNMIIFNDNDNANPVVVYTIKH